MNDIPAMDWLDVKTRVRLLEERIAALEKKWEERLNGKFDIEYNRVTARWEIATLVDQIRDCIEPRDIIYLVGDDGKTVGYIRTDPPGTESSGSDATPATSDRGTGEREDSVGRRRRREIFDGSGILHAEGSDQ